MATSYGDHNPTARNTLAEGAVVGAGLHRSRKVFNLSTDEDAAGGTGNALHAARIREGNAIEGCKISSTANLSGITFTLGTPADPDKYATATTGPAAGATVVFAILPALLAADPLAAPEDIILTPSGNLAASGTVVTSVTHTHR